jgi:Protein of unknown function (DUF3228)
MKGLNFLLKLGTGTLATTHHRKIFSLKMTTTPNNIMNTTTTTSMTMKRALVIDPFCYRQFAENESSSRSYSGTVFTIPMEEFTTIVNERYYSGDSPLQDGYAPFCKHMFVINDFTDAKVNILPITKDNEHLLRTRYEARNEKELPVLTRWFPRELVIDKDQSLPVAKYLDLILYSREQIQKENEAQGRTNDNDDPSPWGIVSIKAQDVPYELPMTPITAMRNALGKEEGGSGIPINRQQYMEAYEFWDKHAIVS